MNMVPSQPRDDVARATEIVARHSLPNFITSFDVRLGEFDGDPAMWIVFRTLNDRPSEQLGLKARIDALRSLSTTVQRELLDAFADRFPCVRFEPAVEADPTHH